MERLSGLVKTYRNALLALNDEEGALLILQRAVGKSPPVLSVYSTATFDLLTEAHLPISFPPTALITRRDWACVWGDSHSSEHCAVLSISSPAVAEVLKPLRVPVLEAKWYPLAEDVVVLLMADFYIRMYDIPWRATPCFELNIAKTFGYECCPISFVFPPDSSDATFYRFSCYILQQDGSVYALNPLLPNKAVVSDSFARLGEVARERRLAAIEPKIRDWCYNLLDTANRDVSNCYTLSLTPELRTLYTPLPIGPLRPPTSSTYTQLICISASQPLVLFAIRDCGTIDIYATFADFPPNFSSDKRSCQLTQLEPITFPQCEGSLSQKPQLVPMNDTTWMYLIGNRAFELDVHWVADWRQKYETRELHSIQRPAVLPILITEVQGLQSAVFLQSRIHEKTLLLATQSGVLVQSFGAAPIASTSAIIDSAAISSSQIARDTLKPKVPALLQVPNPPQTPTEETADESQRLLQLSKVIDQLMETRVIPITKRVHFLLSLLAELKNRRDEDEGSLQEHRKCLETDFARMSAELRKKLENAVTNCQKLRGNIESISQKMNRVFAPLSEEELEIQGKVRRLHTLTEQLKVEAVVHRDEALHSSKCPEAVKCRLRFPCPIEVREALEKLSQLSAHLDEAESQYRSLPR